MAFTWNPLALAGILDLLISWPIAWLIFSTRPDRLQNQALAGFLFLSGLFGFIAYGLRLLFDGTDSIRIVHALGTPLFMAWALAIFSYFAFVATIRSPVTDWLHRRGPWFFIVPVLVALTLSPLFVPEIWWTGLLPWRHSPGWQYDVGWWVLNVWPWIIIAIDLLGIIAASMALRIAKTRSIRRQMAWFTAAFVSYDVLSIALQLLLRFSVNEHTSGPFWERFYFVMGVMPTVVAVLLLSYGMLKTQLLGIDLHIKWTINKATIASAFLAVFFVVSVAASEFLVDRLGYLFGAGAVGLMFLALRPLQRLGEQVAHAAMPNVADTPEYRERRGREIYEVTFSEMVADGKVTEKEKDALAALAESLGLKPTDVRAIEKRIS